MGFDKHYANRKDQREPYRGSKSFDRSCRNHGSCPYCEGARTVWRKRIAAEERLAWEDFDSASLEDVGNPVPGRSLGPALGSVV